MKPHRIGLWIYELRVKLSNDLPYMLESWFHDSIGTIGETTLMSNVVAHWDASYIRSTWNGCPILCLFSTHTI